MARAPGFLALAATLLLAAACAPRRAERPAPERPAGPVADFWKGPGRTDVTFVAFGDPQFGGGSPDKNLLHVTALNAVDAGLRWPPEAFGVDEPIAHVRGVIIAGDLTQNGLDGRWFSADEYGQFLALYGLTGDRALRFPVYEGYGNHDFFCWRHPAYRLPRAHPVADSVARRNAARPGVMDAAPGRDGHYAWEWDSIHFVMLNLAASDRDPRDAVPGHRDPRHALSFLRADLARHVQGTRKRVVVITHYGFFPEWDFSGWWTPEEANAYFEAIRDYPVIAHIHGHDHGTRAYTWKGIQVLNVGSPYYEEYNTDGRGHFTVFRITDDALFAGDAAWTPAHPEAGIRFPAGWQVVVPLKPLP